MKKLNIYKVYLECVDGSLFSTFIPAESEKDAVKYCEGNGECIAVKETNQLKICVDTLAETLVKDGWGRAEIEIITRTLELSGVSQ